MSSEDTIANANTDLFELFDFDLTTNQDQAISLNSIDFL